MAAANQPIRLVICIDGTYCTPDGPHGRGDGNISNVYRICASVKTGTCLDGFFQERHYYPGIGSADEVGSLKKLRTGIFGDGYQDIIEEVYERCCKLTAKDEIWLYGFSRGAYIARAVAGLLHYIGALTSIGENFKHEYKKALEVYKSTEKRSRIGPGQFHSFLSLHTKPKAKIQFVGVFDTVKALNDASLHDISFNASTRHLRHALALNEEREAMTPEYVFPDYKDQSMRSSDRSIVQAWFFGAHIDMGGSAGKDGLSLYPLQWMLFESQSLGLVLEFSGDFEQRVHIDNPLRVVFPDGEAEGRRMDFWECTTANEMNVMMQDLRGVHELPTYGGRYSVHLNISKGWWPKAPRTPFNDDGTLRGYCSFAPQGTILHPSVYLLLDEYLYTTLNKKILPNLEAIERLRPKMLGMQGERSELLNQGFWGENGGVKIDDLPFIRILVCGNTGVGKSTLINRIFGVEELTASSDRNRGVHRIDQGLVHSNRSDLIIHDSGGFEAGDKSQLQAVENFVKGKAGQIRLEDRLHAIWFCIEMNCVRIKQTATEELFKAVSRYANDIPIILVVTKMDDFVSIQFGKAMKLVQDLYQGDDLREKCDHMAAVDVENRMIFIENEINEIAKGRFDASVCVAKDEPFSIKQLNQRTLDSFNHEKVRLIYVAAQVASIDMKIDCAIIETMKVYRDALGTAAGLGLIPTAPTTNRTAAAVAICRVVVKCFGLPTLNSETIWEVVKLNLRDDASHNLSIVLAEGIAVLGVVGSLVLGGMPVFLASHAVNIPLVVPATSRLMLLLASDLILILTRAFKETMYTCVGQPQLKDVVNATTWYRGMSITVHKKIFELVPKRNLAKSFRYNDVRMGLEKVVHTFKNEIIEATAPDISLLRVQPNQIRQAANTKRLSWKSDLEEDVEKDIQEAINDILPSYQVTQDRAREAGFKGEWGAYR